MIVQTYFAIKSVTDRNIRIIEYFLCEMCREIIKNFYNENVSTRSLLLFIINLLIFGLLAYAVIYGSIKDNEILFTFGIILSAAITTKWVDSIVQFRKEVKDRMNKLRSSIKLFIFLWNNDHSYLENPVKEIGKNLLNDVLPYEIIVPKNKYKELNELYGLINSIRINPGVCKKNYKEENFAEEKHYSSKNMNKIVTLCEKYKKIR